MVLGVSFFTLDGPISEDGLKDTGTFREDFSELLDTFKSDAGPLPDAANERALEHISRVTRVNAVTIQGDCNQNKSAVASKVELWRFALGAAVPRGEKTRHGDLKPRLDSYGSNRKGFVR